MTDRFVYVTYIRTTAEKLWDALLKPEFTRVYSRHAFGSRRQPSAGAERIHRVEVAGPSR